ncbi:MAG: chemotaxis protein CheD [candidate division FCPU426 bacterium]
MPERIKVGMASWKVARSRDILVTFGLGSCVGLGLWDPETHIAAMAHIMLPDSKQPRFRQELNPAKFADTAVKTMLDHFLQTGIPFSRLQAKLVGGANMFAFPGRNGGTEGNISIGQRNVQAVKDKLREFSIPVVGEDTGGSQGRSVEYYADSGLMKIRTALTGEREL